MRNFVTLVKALLKQGNPLGGMKIASKKKNARGSNRSSWMASLVASVILLGMMGSIGYGIGQISLMIDMNKLLFLALIVGTSAMVLFIAIPTIISTFYVADDIETLLTLPVSPITIVAAKFAVGLLYSYATVGIFFVPILVGFGIATGAGFEFWFASVVSSLLLPVVPFAYAAIIALVVARFFKAVRTKDGVSALTMVMSILAAGAILAVEYAMGVYGNTSEDTLLSLSNSEGVISGIAAVFPSSGFSAAAMAGEGLVNLLIALGVCVLAVGVVLLVAWLFYLPAVTNLSAGSVGSRSFDAVQIRNALGAKSSYKAYVDLEWTRIWRAPVVVFNCVVGAFILPAIVIISMVASWIAVAGGAAAAQADFSDMIAELGPMAGPVATLAVCGLVVYSLLANMLSPTAITRWGSDWEAMKTLPVSYEDQIKAKLTPGVVLGFVVAGLVVLVVMVPLCILGISPIYLLLSVVFCVAAVLLFNVVSIVPDTKNPRLVWESEQEAIKTSFAPFLAELPSILFVTALLVGTGFAWGVLSWNFLAVFAVATALVVLACVFYGKNRFEKAVYYLATLEG